MSRALIYAAAEEGAYLHFPMDDLESCFWVVLWSVLFNKDREELLLARERDIREALAEGSRDRAAGRLGFLKTKSSVMQPFRPVLMAWWYKIQDKGPGLAQVKRCAPADAGEEYYLPHFHRSALQGVVDICLHPLHWAHVIIQDLVR